MVAPSDPGVTVGRGEQRFDLWLVEVGDRRFLVSFGGDLEHAADVGGVLGVSGGGVLVERVDRRQPGVAGPDGVAAVCFEVVEERADQRRVEIGEVKLTRLLAGLLLRELQQQPQRVAVSSDRPWADVLLGHQPVGEERLKRRREQAHRFAPIALSRSRATSSSNSGTACRYQ